MSAGERTDEAAAAQLHALIEGVSPVAQGVAEDVAEDVGDEIGCGRRKLDDRNAERRRLKLARNAA